MSFPDRLAHGSGVTMSRDPTRLLLSFKAAQTREGIEDRLQGTGLILEDAGDRSSERERPARAIVNHTNRKFWVRSGDDERITDDNLDAMQRRLRGKLEWVGPVYRLARTHGRGGLLCPFPDVLLIKPAAGLDAERLNQVLGRYGLKEVAAKSRYLRGYRYYVVDATQETTVHEIQTRLLAYERSFVREARFENMPMLVPLIVNPDDPLFSSQWNMTQIQAGGSGTTGWDLSTGSAQVVICILDYGCDLTHPDLAFASPGINLGSMGGDGSPTGVASEPSTLYHGTACAGIAAATFNNNLGVAGVAGNCQILPVAVENATEPEINAGITYAADNGAQVISMSFGHYGQGEESLCPWWRLGNCYSGWDFAIIDPAISYAYDAGCVLCAGTGNDDLSAANLYPARHPLVIACGASDQADNRKGLNLLSPPWWGSNYGEDIHLGQTTGVSVVAPGVDIPTTDLQGADGANPSAGPAGDYFSTFEGTSAATPHVAGLAALLRSLYPALTNAQVRAVIERTAEKVGDTAYEERVGFGSGTRNQEMGYGRINVYRALDFADVLIRDYPDDVGNEPSTPPGGNNWDYSDIVVRPNDDGVFLPEDVSQSGQIVLGQTNYLYVRVTNNGPADARNVVVDARLQPYVGLAFVYPDDWTLNDTTHLVPTPVTNVFQAVADGSEVIAKFTISPQQVQDAWGWVNGGEWHPCILAHVLADNDYAFASWAEGGSGVIKRRNNLANRNLSVVDVSPGAMMMFPFIAGSAFDTDRVIEIVINRSRLPRSMRLVLGVDEDMRAFPRLPQRGQSRINLVGITHASILLRDNRRYLGIGRDITSVKMEKDPGHGYPLALRTKIPENAARGHQYAISVWQRTRRGDMVGGATVVYRVK